MQYNTTVDHKCPIAASEKRMDQPHAALLPVIIHAKLYATLAHDLSFLGRLILRYLVFDFW